LTELKNLGRILESCEGSRRVLASQFWSRKTNWGEAKKRGKAMKYSSKHLIPNALILVSVLFLLFGCSQTKQTKRPDEKSALLSWPTYEQILKENYKGPKARVVVLKFVNKSTMGKETSPIGDGMAEMLHNALLATNRYIVQLRKSLDDVFRGQNAGDGGQLTKGEEIDLLVEGEIREFIPGIPGAGDEEGEASYVTLKLTVTDSRTQKVLATGKVRGKGTNFGGTVGRVGGVLPEVLRDFSKTPMEKAIRIAIEESASFIVAKTPPECYRVPTVIPPRESSKPPPESSKVIPPPSPAPPPPLRVTKVIWAAVNLREGPGTSYRVIGNVKRGTSLGILEAKGDWLHVRLDDGSEAWISKAATSEAPKPPPTSPTTPSKPAPM
jgi:curli biogenesis system outer membrane secretion channel CsgG